MASSSNPSSKNGEALGPRGQNANDEDNSGSSGESRLFNQNANQESRNNNVSPENNANAPNGSGQIEIGAIANDGIHGGNNEGIERGQNIERDTNVNIRDNDRNDINVSANVRNNTSGGNTNEPIDEGRGQEEVIVDNKRRHDIDENVRQGHVGNNNDTNVRRNNAANGGRNGNHCNNERLVSWPVMSRNSRNSQSHHNRVGDNFARSSNADRNNMNRGTVSWPVLTRDGNSDADSSFARSITSRLVNDLCANRYGYTTNINNSRNARPAASDIAATSATAARESIETAVASLENVGTSDETKSEDAVKPSDEADKATDATAAVAKNEPPSSTVTRERDDATSQEEGPNGKKLRSGGDTDGTDHTSEEAGSADEEI